MSATATTTRTFEAPVLSTPGETGQQEPQAPGEFQFETDIVPRLQWDVAQQQVVHEDSYVANPAAGVYVLTDAFGSQQPGAGRPASDLVANSLAKIMSSEAFDPDNSTDFGIMAVNATQQAFVAEAPRLGVDDNVGVSATALRFFRSEAGGLNVLVLQVGHTDAKVRKQDGEIVPLVERQINDNGEVISSFGVSTSKDQPVAVKVFSGIQPGDRFMLMSGGTAGGGMTESGQPIQLLTPEAIAAASNQPTPGDVARGINEAQPSRVDKTTMVIDVPEDVDIRATGWRRFTPRALLNRIREARANKNRDGERRTVWQRTRNLGAVAMTPSMWGNRNNSRGVEAHGSHAATIDGQAIDGRETRTSKREYIKSLGKLAVLSGFAFLFYKGMDIIPDTTAFGGWYPDVFSDGDHIDVWPTYGDSHATNYDGNFITTAWLDDDPGRIIPASELVDNGIDASDVIDLDNEPQVVDAPPAPVVVAPTLEPINVPDGGSVSQSLHSIGDDLRGSAFDDQDAWAAYMKLEPTLDANSMQAVGSDEPGLYPMHDGHWGVVDDGTFEFSPEAEQAAVKIIKELDLAAQ